MKSASSKGVIMTITTSACSTLWVNKNDERT